MKVYLDNCMLNRPFDDQTQERIFLETQAFLILLKYIENGDIELITSFINTYEADSISYFDRKNKISNYLSLSHMNINLDNEIKLRALSLSRLGFTGIDALHLACVEAGNADYFVTYDDQVSKLANKNAHQITVKVVSLFKVIEDLYHVKNNK